MTMIPLPSSCPTPIPSPCQLTLPFDEAAPPAPPLLPSVAETRRMGVRPRTIWRTLSPSHREQARCMLLQVATALLREEGTADESDEQ